MMLELFPGDGCGNRFLLVREKDAHMAGEDVVSLATRLCGEAFDGLLVIGNPGTGAMPVSILNRDGSDGGACLNGLRVAACFTGADSGRLQMAGRVVEWRRVTNGIELHLPQCFADLEVEELALSDGREGHAVAFWNPHAVFAFDEASEEVPLPRFDLQGLAHTVRASTERFPLGVNVEMVEGLGRSTELTMRVEERGVGETAACGSGALAVAAVAWELGAEERIGVTMPGGRLELERSEDGSIRLRGAARTGPGKPLSELLRAKHKTLS
ncbi:MAG: diaminopimelate epimerase [Planctomycetota bacterium]|jgi:diaminopimelate epimerase